MSNNRPTSTKRPVSTPAHKAVKKASYHRDMTTINIIITVITVLVDIMMMFIALNITRYSSFSKTTFILVNVVLLVVLLIINIGAVYLIRTKRKGLLNGLLALLIILGLVGGYGTFAIAKVNFNINRITDSGTTKTETVEASVVVFSNDGNYSITDVSELDGKVVGVPTGTNIETIAKSNLENAGVNATYVEYDDYANTFINLIGGNVDAAVLPSNYATVFATEDGVSEYLDNTNILTSYSENVTVEGGTTNNSKDLTSEPFTVLLIGTADGLSDAIMVATVNPISMKVTITSIARDSYVPISCYNGNSSKINSARGNSVQCLINTVQNLLGIEIDYYVDTNFQGVVDVVNALGGITITNSTDFVGQSASSERGHYTVYVPAGEDVPVDGEQALAFARERHLYASGDFQRQKNQQQVIMSILTKLLRTRDVNTALNVLQAAGDNVSTNFTVDQLTTFFNYVMKKADRYYDDTHVENVFLIQTSRVTGYTSSVWNESAQLALSIVVPYQGSIGDNKNAITRNTDMNSTPTGKKYTRWDASWEFAIPTITNDVYSEAIVQSQTPESYYCSKSGGTWNGSSCSCPGGNEYISQSGCVADSAANYADQGSCIAAGFKWAGTYCANTCPDGTVSNNGLCQGTATPKTCQTNATLGADGVTCVCNAGYTKDGSGNCVASATTAPTCSMSNLTACTDAGACSSIGAYWNGSSCQASAPAPTCSASNLTACTDAGSCSSVGAYWDGSACQAAPPATPACSLTSLSSCTDASLCSSIGAYWDGSTCLASAPIPDPGCAGSGGTWNSTTGSCTCPAESPTFNGTSCVNP